MLRPLKIALIARLNSVKTPARLLDFSSELIMRSPPPIFVSAGIYRDIFKWESFITGHEPETSCSGYYFRQNPLYFSQN